AQITATTPEALQQADSALRDLGKPARHQTVQLSIAGMTCGSCVGRVERDIKALPGVVSANVSLAAESAQVEILQGVVTPSQVAAASTEAG
ncbi:heavy metal-associated domain-containing protein, partial [Pseudomonas sp. SIMBA_044]